MACLSLILGAVPRYVPSEVALGPLARIFDSLSHALLLAAFLLALASVALGARRTGILCALAALAAAGQLYATHHRLSVPPAHDRDTAFRVVYLNVLGSNVASGAAVVTEVMSLDPDVVVFSEAEPIIPELGRLAQSYEFGSLCDPGSCDLLMIGKSPPLRFWRLSLNPVWEDRYGVAEFELESGERLFVAASHLAKPWLSGISEGEWSRLAGQYNWFEGPVVAIGDFNAAPWSLPMRRLLSETGMRAMRAPRSTWPTGLGRFGVPIDQVLVRGGAQVVRVETFGAGLGSNHLGLVADIALP